MLSIQYSIAIVLNFAAYKDTPFEPPFTYGFLKLHPNCHALHHRFPELTSDWSQIHDSPRPNVPFGTGGHSPFTPPERSVRYGRAFTIHHSPFTSHLQIIS
jgi:hypothetical protein